MEKQIPAAVIEAIQRKFFPDVEQIRKVLAELRYDSLNRCWYFTHAGMYHGVEEDGYIHT
jgi:hypothetical protein